MTSSSRTLKALSSSLADHFFVILPFVACFFPVDAAVTLLLMNNHLDQCSLIQTCCCRGYNQVFEKDLLKPKQQDYLQDLILQQVCIIKKTDEPQFVTIKVSLCYLHLEVILLRYSISLALQRTSFIRFPVQVKGNFNVLSHQT